MLFGKFTVPRRWPLDVMAAAVFVAGQSVRGRSTGLVEPLGIGETDVAARAPKGSPAVPHERSLALVRRATIR